MTDERKNVFIETVERLFEIVKYDENRSIDIFIPDEAIDFFNDYKKGKSSNKKIITEKGIIIINAMRELDEDWITAKSLSEHIDMTPKSISGSMKKLVTDGFVEKLAGNPASYKLTEKGFNFENSLPEEEI